MRIVVLLFKLVIGLVSSMGELLGGAALLVVSASDMAFNKDNDKSKK